METMTDFFETEPLIDLDFAKQSRLAGQWAPPILFFFFSISTFPTLKLQEHAACQHAPLFFTWILRTELRSSWLTHVSLYILHVKTIPHPTSRTVDQERAKNSVAFSAWFSQVSSSYHSDTSQAHRKKPRGSEQLGKGGPSRLVQVALHQEWCCQSSRDRLVKGRPLIIIVSRAWCVLKTNSLFPRERRGWMRKEGRKSGEWMSFPSRLTSR